MLPELRAAHQGREVALQRFDGRRPRARGEAPCPWPLPFRERRDAWPRTAAGTGPGGAASRPGSSRVRDQPGRCGGERAACANDPSAWVIPRALTGWRGVRDLTSWPNALRSPRCSARRPAGSQLWVAIAGRSLYPLARGGDRLLVTRCAPTMLRPGEVVVGANADGALLPRARLRSLRRGPRASSGSSMSHRSSCSVTPPCSSAVLCACRSASGCGRSSADSRERPLCGQSRRYGEPASACSKTRCCVRRGGPSVARCLFGGWNRTTPP